MFYMMIVTSMVGGTLLQSDLRDEWLEEDIRVGIDEGVGELASLTLGAGAKPPIPIRVTVAYVFAR